MEIIDRAKIYEFLEKLPAFPSSIQKVIQLANDLNAAPKDLVFSIQTDSVLTGRILRTINSAYFAMREKVVSINRAVVMLGMNTIKNIALSSALTSSIKIKSKFKPISEEQFWEHSLSVAVATKLIGKAMGVDKNRIEEFFVAGLLHDIGKVVFINFMADLYEKAYDAYKPGGKTLHEIEAEMFGLDHAEVGLLLAEKWEMPVHLRECIAEHHMPILNNTDRLDMRMAVYIANIACHARKIGIPLDVFETEVPDIIWPHFTLPKEAVDRALTNLEGEVESAKVFLQT